MPRNIDPRLNASLIREGRMIFRQLSQIFGERRQRPTNTNMWDTLKQSEVKVIALTCEPCMRSEIRVPEPAITVSKGFAVCHRHLLARD